MKQVDILVVGGGAAGIAAAMAAYDAGCRSILLADRGNRLGGVLLQCAHRGFGDGQTGFAYADGLLRDFPKEIHLSLDTSVLSVTEDKTALLSNSQSGLEQIRFSELIFAAGCREIPAGALPIAGTRPEGVYTAGQMQAMMNLDGYLSEGPVVILGSGDLGLILANQLWEAGIPVTLVEKSPACGGLARNRKRIISGQIPLLCGCTVSEICGDPRLEQVVLSDGSKIYCKTLLTAVGLRPDRDLIRSLGTPDWLHICGNCRSVHPMVESVVAEGKKAGIAAYQNLRGML